MMVVTRRDVARWTVDRRLAGVSLVRRLWRLGWGVFGRRSGDPGNVDVDVKFLEFLVDEVEGRCDYRVRHLHSFQGDNAELQLIQCARCGVFQCLNFEQED